MEQTNEVKNSPEIHFRAGPISLTVWNNPSEKGSYNTVQISRSYKDGNQNWKHANSLRANDIPKAVLLLNKAYEYLVLKKASSSQGEDIQA